MLQPFPCSWLLAFLFLSAWTKHSGAVAHQLGSTGESQAVEGCQGPLSASVMWSFGHSDMMPVSKQGWVIRKAL